MGATDLPSLLVDVGQEVGQVNVFSRLEGHSQQARQTMITWRGVVKTKTGLLRVARAIAPPDESRSGHNVFR